MGVTDPKDSLFVHEWDRCLKTYWALPEKEQKKRKGTHDEHFYQILRHDPRWDVRVVAGEWNVLDSMVDAEEHYRGAKIIHYLQDRKRANPGSWRKHWFSVYKQVKDKYTVVEKWEKYDPVVLNVSTEKELLPDNFTEEFKRIGCRFSKNAKVGLKQLVQENLNINSVIVEIGSFAGESSYIFARAVNQLHCIDPWINPKGFDQNNCASENDMSMVELCFDHRMQGFKNVTKIKDFSENVLDKFEDGSLDLVYIDSIHTYDCVKQCIKEWLPKIKPGGKIAGHDYQNKFPGVVKAIDEFKGNRPIKVYKDTSWVIQL
jgi:predicted O-methyltransferase YrrM